MDPVKFIEDNPGTINHLVNKYYFPTSKFDREDLMAEAILHTVTACQAFDADKGNCKINSFVATQVDRRVRRFVSKNKYDLTVGEYAQGTETLSNAVYADRLEREIKNNDAHKPNVFTVKETIPCSGIGPSNILEEKERLEMLHEAIESLGELERNVIKSHWFQDRTLVDLASELGFSKQYLHKVEKRAIENLSNKLKSLNVD